MLQKYKKSDLVAIILITFLGISSTSCTGKNPNPVPSARTPLPSASSPLPSCPLWKNGVSSCLFGTNDTEEWDVTNNVETDPYHIIQPSLKSAGFTLMRSFFFHHSLRDGHRTTMAEIDQRLATIENSGMICLGVLAPVRTDPAHPGSDSAGDTDLDFDKQVVAHAGNRCNMYEFGNEPDLGDDQLTVQQYLHQWNEFIPILREINPQAKFIGPVTCTWQGNNCDSNGRPSDCFMGSFLEGVKASKVLPDAISFHEYPCTDNANAAQCILNTKYYADLTTTVKGWVREILGKDLPVGITEWNMDSGNNQTLANDCNFMEQFSVKALKAMISAHLDFANQFDAQSYSGYGTLDMFDRDNNDQPKCQFNAIKDLISQYR